MTLINRHKDIEAQMAKQNKERIKHQKINSGSFWDLTRNLPMKPRDLFTDDIIKLRDQTPSLGQYNPKSTAKIPLGKISKSEVGDLFSEIQYLARESPSPGDYSPKVSFKFHRSSSMIKRPRGRLAVPESKSRRPRIGILICYRPSRTEVGPTSSWRQSAITSHLTFLRRQASALMTLKSPAITLAAKIHNGPWSKKSACSA